MATPTYDPIASYTISSLTYSVTFANLDSVASGYRDLVIAINFGSSNAGDCTIEFNSDTGNKSDVYMFGDGSSASSGTTSQLYAGFGAAGSSLIHIFDFAQTDKHKTVISRFGHSTIGVQARAGRWASTAAITQVKLYQDFNAGTTISLYGIAA